MLLAGLSWSHSLVNQYFKNKGAYSKMIFTAKPKKNIFGSSKDHLFEEPLRKQC